MATTYEPIATTTLGSAASSITFSSITSAYTDLRIIMNVAGGGSSNFVQIRFNSDATSNYSRTSLIADGSTVTSTRASATNGLLNVAASGSVQPELILADIFSYSNTSVYKTWLSSDNSDANGSGNVGRIVGLWRSTAAIDTILLQGNTGNFAAGTTATLYGILKA